MNGALGTPPFRRFWTGHLLSSVGTRMQEAALVWHLYALTESPLALGALGLARLVPVVLLLLVGGVAADRFDRRTVLLGSQLGGVVAAAALGWLTLAGRATPLLIYGVAALVEASQAFDSPARKSLIPHLVPQDQVGSATSFADVAKNTAKLCGPVLMGLFVAVADIGWVYLLNAASYAAMIAALLSLPDTNQRKGSAATFGAAVSEALSWVWRARAVQGLVVLDFAATFFASAQTLLPLYTVEVLDQGSFTYGVLAGAGAAGALGAGLVLAVWTPRRPATVALWSAGLFGLATVVVGLASHVVLAWLALAAIGATDSVSTVLRNTVVQLRTPDALRGRVTAVATMFSKAGPRLGETEAGAVAALLGVPGSIAVGGVLAVAAAGAVAWGFPEMWAEEAAPGSTGREVPPPDPRGDDPPPP